MGKNLEVVVLLDFYGQLLTDKQREVLELYYNEDLSLAEIAQNTGSITRQGVRDSIKRGEQALFGMEEKLGLVAKMADIKSNMQSIQQFAEEIRRQNKQYCQNSKIERCAVQIEQIALSTEE